MLSFPKKRIFALLQHLIVLPKIRFLVFLGIYLVVFVFSYLLSVSLQGRGIDRETLVPILLLILVVKLLLLALYGQFRGLLSYFDMPDLQRLGQALIWSVLILLVIGMAHEGLLTPRTIILDFLVSLLCLSSIRLVFRLIRERWFMAPSAQSKTLRPARVAIIGAGTTGAVLAKSISNDTIPNLKLVAFFDDNVALHGATIQGVPIVGGTSELESLSKIYKLEVAIIAIPSLSPGKLSAILKVIGNCGLRSMISSGVEKMLESPSALGSLRPLQIDDLLERQKVEINFESVGETLRGKTIIVTGAGGSIGLELCNQVLLFNPHRLILIDRAEGSLFNTLQALPKAKLPNCLTYVTDICNEAKMKQILSTHKPYAIFHAAAHKHVGMMENQVCEAIHNNALGVLKFAKLALNLDFGLKRFVLISTDKAIHPSSVMGASKRLAEMFMQHIHKAAESSNAALICIRFGNVLGSSGSVVQLFQKQIDAGGPVLVTHKDATRYFMTIPEAVGLVLQGAIFGNNGELLLLDMGEPIKIIDLAHKMILLRGKQVGVDIEIEFIGLRPGEKLIERLNYDDEQLTPTSHSKIYLVNGTPIEPQAIKQAVDEVQSIVNSHDDELARRWLRSVVREYRSDIHEYH